jgi:hypothetical protein
MLLHSSGHDSPNTGAHLHIECFHLLPLIVFTLEVEQLVVATVSDCRKVIIGMTLIDFSPTTVAKTLLAFRTRHLKMQVRLRKKSSVTKHTWLHPRDFSTCTRHPGHAMVDV